MINKIMQKKFINNLFLYKFKVINIINYKDNNKKPVGQEKKYLELDIKQSFKT